MAVPISQGLHQQSAAELHPFSNKDLLTSYSAAQIGFPDATAEIEFGNLFEQAYYSWYRWHFLTKEFIDMTAQYSTEEAARCIRCGFSTCTCFFWCWHPIADCPPH